ncbi:tripartite tricarboxylate transporter TctB family protein [Anaerobacillus sp. MEB173]|uniref:tripartite tricarboxylate transporter TctB family protein n=1 Tax=Anaerobacillus sp. MEB173 TaxID=3383345 RepID=UPI003F91C4CD
MVNRIFAGVVLIVAGIFFIESRGFSEKTGMQTFAPSLFPTIILALMSVLAITVFIRSFFEEKDSIALFTRVRVYMAEHWRVLSMIGLLFIYIYLLTVVGFFISTIAFLLIAFSILGQVTKKLLVANVALALLIPFSVQWVFQNVLNIYLP